jgi:hypothetical protein
MLGFADHVAQIHPEQLPRLIEETMGATRNRWPEGSAARARCAGYEFEPAALDQNPASHRLREQKAKRLFNAGIEVCRKRGLGF